MIPSTTDIDIIFEQPVPMGISKSDTEKVADLVRSKLGFEPGDDPKKIVERLGGKIEIQSDLHGKESGTLVVSGNQDFVIYLAPFTSQMHDKFTIAHELGHYILHSNFGDKKIVVNRSSASGRLEWEANWFAAALLMPKKQFLEDCKAGMSEIELADKYRVSLQAIQVRRKSLG